MKENEVQKIAVNNSLTTFANMDEIEAFGERIAKSGISPITEGKGVVAAILYGRELGLEPMTAVNNIYPIKGRGTLSVHLINALLQKAGVITEVVRDYEPCVYFAIKGDDGKAIITDGSPVIVREGFADESAKDTEVKGTKIVNYRTILKLTRKVKQPDNTWKDMSITATYSILEASTAGLTAKDNWKCYPKQMVLNRALAFGGRLIGADVLLGMYETTELLDANNLDYKMEEGKVIILDSKVNKSDGSNKTTNIVKEENAQASKHDDINKDEQ